MPAPATPTGFQEAAADGTTNSTTEVTLVAAPGANATRTVKILTVFNADTASGTFTLRYKSAANTRVLEKRTLAPNESYIYEGPLHLDATNKSLTIILAAAVAANQMDWTVHYAEIT